MLKRSLALILAAVLILPPSAVPAAAAGMKAQETTTISPITLSVASQAGPQSLGGIQALSQSTAFTATVAPTAALTLPAPAAALKTSALPVASPAAALKAAPANAAASSFKPAASAQAQNGANPQVRAAVLDFGVFDGAGRLRQLPADHPVAGSFGAGHRGLTAASGAATASQSTLPSPPASSKSHTVKRASPFSWLRKGAAALMIGATMLLASCAKEDIEPMGPDLPGIEAYHITSEQIWEDINKTPSSATLPPNDYIDQVRTHDNDLVYRTRVNSTSELTAYLEGIDGAKIDLLLVDDSGNILARDNNLTDPYFYENGFAAEVPPGDYFLIIHNNDDTGVGQTTYFEWTIDPR